MRCVVQQARSCGRTQMDGRKSGSRVSLEPAWMPSAEGRRDDSACHDTLQLCTRGRVPPSPAAVHIRQEHLTIQGDLITLLGIEVHRSTTCKQHNAQSAAWRDQEAGIKRQQVQHTAPEPGHRRRERTEDAGGRR